MVITCHSHCGAEKDTKLATEIMPVTWPTWRGILFNKHRSHYNSRVMKQQISRVKMIGTLVNQQ